MSAPTGTPLSSTEVFKPPPLEDEMKGREVALGYLIDDNFVQRFYLNQARSKGLDDDKALKAPFKRHVKATIARQAAWVAGSSIAILHVSLPRDNGEKEAAIFVSFHMRGRTYVDKYLPTTGELTKFKARLFLAADHNPKWRIMK
ncbi:hypothetical protein F5887DRAFT_1074186 [Amanita rubescens]|nr:hypothetical protein F5887DRAFT_1074186 [Amanita rubescens]